MRRESGVVFKHNGGGVSGSVVDDDNLAVADAVELEQMRKHALEDGCSVMGGNDEAEHGGCQAVMAHLTYSR